MQEWANQQAGECGHFSVINQATQFNQRQKSESTGMFNI